MRERRDAARLVNAREDLFGRRRRARGTNAGRPRDSQRVERLAGASPRGRRRRARARSTAGRDLRRIVERRLQDRVGVERACRARPSRATISPHAIDAPPPLLGEKRAQRGDADVDEVAEHVDVDVRREPR